MLNWKHRTSAILVLVSAVGWTSHPVTGQTPFFSHLGIDDGLSQATVYAIAKDTVGYMWFATEDGLNRYDGREFRVFRHHTLDSSSISSNAILSLHVSRTGELWAGTADGVDRYDPRSESFRRYGSAEDGTRGQLIYGIAETEDGTIWAASIGRGLIAIDPESGRSVSHQGRPEDENSLSSNVLGSVTTCDGKTLWVGSRVRPSYVATRPGGEIDHVVRLADRRIGTVYHGKCDPDGTILLSSDTGLYRATRPDTTATLIGEAQHDGQPMAVNVTHADGTGGYWIGTYGLGLYHLDAGGQLTRMSDLALGEGRIADDRIHALLRDEAGTVWVGTASSGVSLWNPLRRRFIHIAPDAEQEGGLRSANVWAAIEDASGRLWIGTTGGAYQMNRDGSFRRFGTADGLKYEQVHGFFLDKAETLWAAANGGVCYLKAGSERFECVEVETANMFVMQIDQDRDGLLWMATRGGLARLDPETESMVAILPGEDPRAGVPSRDIRSVLVDGDDVWIATTNGASRLDRQSLTFQHYAHDPADTTSLSHPVAGAMLSDRRDWIWIGTMGGISILEPSTGALRRIHEDHGLANNVIYAMLEDDRGRIWASSNRGLSRISVAGDSLWGAISIRNFTPDDGLQSYEFNLHSARRLSDGRMIFGGINGFNIFHPDSIADNPVPPAIALTGLSVRGKPYPRPPSSLSELRLAHDQSFFTISFAALDFVSPSQNRYEYRLENLDADWIDAGTRPVATYTSVPPGRYVFRARGSNGDGIWNQAGLSLPIIITPPFWQTWWFRVLMLATIAIALTAAYRVRVRRLLELERMRLRIAGDLHDDVGASLGSIILLSDMVRRSDLLNANDRRRLETITQTAQEMSADLREIVWIVNPEHDRMNDLVARLRQVSTTLLDGIAYKFEAPASLDDARIDMSFRRNVLRAFKEILHNVRKHALAHHVEIRIERRDGALVLHVQDDGRGFEPGIGTNGHGLKSLAERMSRLGGTLEIDSSPGKGATIVCRIPDHANA